MLNPSRPASVRTRSQPRRSDRSWNYDSGEKSNGTPSRSSCQLLKTTRRTKAISAECVVRQKGKTIAEFPLTAGVIGAVHRASRGRDRHVERADCRLLDRGREDRHRTGDHDRPHTEIQASAAVVAAAPARKLLYLSDLKRSADGGRCARFLGTSEQVPRMLLRKSCRPSRDAHRAA